MMEYSNFIGIGINPDGPDIPLGLGMRLAQNPKAMNTFGHMTKDQKAAMIHYIQSVNTGEESKARILEAIQNLSENNTSFF